MLEFSMAGDCSELLAPSILVWCRDSDTKSRVQKYFKEDMWLKEQLLNHELAYHILDKPPRRCAKEVATHQRILYSQEGSSLITSADALTSCGLDLILPDGKRCTVGGLIMIDDVPYLLTSRHGLDKSHKSSTTTSSITTEAGTQLQSSCSDRYSAVPAENDTWSRPHTSHTSTGADAIACCARKPEYSMPHESEVHAVKVLYPPIPTHGQGQSVSPADDFDWAVVDLSDAPISLLGRVLKPNLAEGKEIQGIHVGDCGLVDQHPVPVAVAGMKQRFGLLTNIYSILQVDGSLHDVMLITLDKPMRKSYFMTPWAIHD